MAKESEIPLEKAREVAVKFIDTVLKDIVIGGEICGSIRRKRPVVRDIDVVVRPKNIFTFSSELLRKLPRPAKIIKQGDKLIEVEFEGIQVDIYVANKDTFETIKLIRIGSESHNVKLCSLAKQKGWVLHADGRGLYSADDKVLIANTEDEILTKLLGKVVPPEERE